ncbi:hypothetical protein DFA_01692 [Cavenderia fasciculata]|uniref:Uncharacterized protein n=1 Tax=Cavenderia fasciculata TaxID=261658 RepID=F4PU91_CACFS|nr:uncharacterized protein DFA_01692 [Cavenderia fasciculata]EGG21806.1 hypothetical protein DFA_01692 [Cavenderia fasciculata]|eukprot:XP_004359656.1 hypothetical protein DFA_01692 [Cavenderia fasciculata]
MKRNYLFFLGLLILFLININYIEARNERLNQLLDRLDYLLDQKQAELALEQQIKQQVEERFSSSLGGEFIGPTTWRTTKSPTDR